MVEIRLIPAAEFARVRGAVADRFERHALLADMNRLNVLAAVKRAGSGHLGSSLSALDLAVWLYEEEMNLVAVGPEQFYVTNDHRYAGGFKRFVEEYTRRSWSSVLFYTGWVWFQGCG